MKHAYAFGNLLIAIFLLGVSPSVFAQVSHPLAFGYMGTDSSNWYKDYIGVRFEVTFPNVIAGDKLYSIATRPDGWTSIHSVTTPIVNVPIIMDTAHGDSIACSGIPVGSMAGKIAVIYRSTCEFGYKALQAQGAGAIACVIINNVPGSLPIPMGAGTYGASVTIPTFMISNADGLAISGQYMRGFSTVRMTITPWGLGNQHDVGFFNDGNSLWHDYAVPYKQLSAPSGNNGVPYMGLHGAYIANFGTSRATNVRMTGTSSFIYNDGSVQAIHSDTTAVLSTFNAIDSIYSFFGHQFNFSVPTSGKVHVKYTILQDSVDQYPNDDTTSFTFYATDSLFSKGRYDFTRNIPIASTYLSSSLISTSDDHYIWGNMYYVNHPGSYAKTVQWSMLSSAGVTTSSIFGYVNIYLMKWVDGHGGQPKDSFIQNGELELVGIAVKNFTGDTIVGDTAGGTFSCNFTSDTNRVLDTGKFYEPALDTDSWYFVAVEVPTSPSTWALGCDGINDAYPRTYGRNHFNSYLEYYSAVYGADRYIDPDAMINSGGPGYTLAPCPFGGSGNTDSMVFSSQKGLIPAVSLITTTHPIFPSAVVNVGASSFDFEVYPNPTSDYVNVKIGLQNPAKIVAYTIIDGMAREVRKEVHYNVLNETFTYPTGNLPSGNYYMIVNIDDKPLFKKFTVVRR